MNASTLHYHLQECGVVLALGMDVRSLEIDAPRGVLTPELLEVIREHKEDLVEIVYLFEEAEAIAAEGREGERPSNPVTFEGDALLIERVRNAPAVRVLADFLSAQRGGGVIEVLQKGALAA
jgi:hypothetical protein